MAAKARQERSGDRVMPRTSGISTPVSLATAILAFLAVLLIALGLTGSRLGRELGDPQQQTATIQILADGAAIETEARAALDVLRGTEGVLSVRVIEIEEQRRLLEPWLGTGAAVENLPLPLMIELMTDPAHLDLPRLEATLAAEAPHAILDDHGTLRSDLAQAARGLEIFGFVTCATIALALAAVLLLASRATLLASAGAIRTLRLIGARDGYISAILSRRMTRRAFLTALAGTVAGMAVLALLPSTSQEGFYLVAISPTGLEWLAPCLVPIVAAAIAWFCARHTARRIVRQWS